MYSSNKKTKIYKAQNKVIRKRGGALPPDLIKTLVYSLKPWYTDMIETNFLQ